jgi:hypothetical protein
MRRTARQVLRAAGRKIIELAACPEREVCLSTLGAARDHDHRQTREQLAGKLSRLVAI